MGATTDQDRTVEALSLWHGGWAKAESYSPGVIDVTVAGDHPGYIVSADGSALDRSRDLWLSPEDIQTTVYGEEATS